MEQWVVDGGALHLIIVLMKIWRCLILLSFVAVYACCKRPRRYDDCDIQFSRLVALTSSHPSDHLTCTHFGARSRTVGRKSPDQRSALTMSAYSSDTSPSRFPSNNHWQSSAISSQLSVTDCATSSFNFRPIPCGRTASERSKCYK